MHCSDGKEWAGGGWTLCWEDADDGMETVGWSRIREKVWVFGLSARERSVPFSEVGEH